MPRQRFTPKPGRDLKRKDFAIVAALDEEFSAVRRNMSSVVSNFSDIPFKHYHCLLDLEQDGPLEGLILQPHDTGRVEASVLTSYVLSRFQVRVLGLCGVAGGFKKMVASSKLNIEFGLGDVVFADTLVDTEFQKISAGGLESRDRVFHIDPNIVRSFADFWDERDASFSRPLPLTVSTEHRPEAHIGPLVSGSKVVASTRDSQGIGYRALSIGAHSVPLAVEMEGIGVAVAAWRLGYKDKFFMVKGISDFANEQKSHDEVIWRHKACHNSAVTALEFIRYLAARKNWRRRGNRDPSL